jgi:hypothetical protein
MDSQQLMYRKSLAVLLVCFWVILSGFDLLEDLDESLNPGSQSSRASRVPHGTPGINIANNIVESADRIQPFYADLLELPSAHSSADLSLSFKKTSRLHKLNRVFLI